MKKDKPAGDPKVSNQSEKDGDKKSQKPVSALTTFKRDHKNDLGSIKSLVQSGDQSYDLMTKVNNKL